MLLVTLFLLLRQDVLDACARLPEANSALAIYHHWRNRVAFLEAGAPLWEHRQKEYQRELEYARNRRWYWDKVTDVLYPTYSWNTRQNSLNDLRERGLYRD